MTSIVGWATGTLERRIKSWALFLDAVLAKQLSFFLFKKWSGVNGHGRVKMFPGTTSLRHEDQWLLKIPETRLYVLEDNKFHRFCLRLTSWKNWFCKEMEKTNESVPFILKGIELRVSKQLMLTKMYVEKYDIGTPWRAQLPRKRKTVNLIFALGYRSLHFRHLLNSNGHKQQRINQV